jgi:hypothetical protein
MNRKENLPLEMTIDQDQSISKIRTSSPKFFKIFINMLKESHMLASVVFETLRPFPRVIRTCLLFGQVYLELLFSCFFVCLWGGYKGIDFISLSVVALSQIIIVLIGNINRSSNRRLEKAKNTAQFIEIT